MVMSKIFALSEASSIAIHSMVLIARSKDGINAVKIAEITGFSKNHIAKVLQRLVKIEMLKSVRGPLGGFSMKADPKKVSLLDIYQAMEGPLDVGECPLSYDLCGFDRCLMGTVVGKLTTEFKKFLNEQTLKSYL
jgi:Rrf2 family protein